MQNFDDNECFKSCLVRYLNPADHHVARIKKINKLFGDELDFEDMENFQSILEIFISVEKYYFQ